jgi:hypothetical protein
LDEGKDHLGLFEPFVEDVVCHLPSDHFVAAEVREAVDHTHGLLLPVDTIDTLLGRLRKRGLRREGGRYFRTQPLPSLDITAAKDQVQQQLDALGEALRQFSSVYPAIAIATSEEAIALLLAFLQENNVSILLDEEPESVPAGLSRAQQRLVARFVTQECVRHEGLGVILGRILEGLVLKNALLLQDLATATQRFDDLLVFLDSQILLSIIDLQGTAQGVAARETLALFRDTGAIPSAFDVTLAEIRRLLGMLEDHLATAEGRLTLRPTPLVRHVLSADLKPSDMRIFGASLEAQLRRLGIQLHDTPQRDRRFTLNEDALARQLTDATRDIHQYRVRHDVDCVAAVLTLRAGRHPPRLESAHAAFVSTSPRVIRNVTAWYRAQGETGLAPIIDFRVLTNIAWLKKPASARSLKVHELVALCAAALRPTKETWDKFVTTLKDMRAQGTLSDEETVALVASDLAEPILAELEDERDPDAATIHEAIDRIKTSYREQGYTAAQELIHEAQSAATVAKQAAALAATKQASLDTHLEKLSHLAGTIAGSVAMLLLAVLVLGTTAIAIPGVLEAFPSRLRPLSWLLLALSGILTFWGYWSGFTIRDLRLAIEERVAARFLRLLRPPDNGRQD